MGMTGVYDVSTIQTLSINLDRTKYKLEENAAEKIMLLKKLLNIKETNFVKPINTPFKATVIEKKIGIDRIIDEIRVMLNKISETTINKYTNLIIEKINNLQHDISSDEFIKIGDTIFSIACMNVFYVHLYADLYKELIDNFAFFTHIFNNNVESYLELFDVIEIVDPIKDYNKYCEVKKQNDARKATSAFYTHLMLKGILDKKIILNLMLKLQNKLENNKCNKEKKDENIELCENIAIFIELGKNVLKNELQWEEIISNIKLISSSPLASNEGLTNKIIFKYMEILDMITT